MFDVSLQKRKHAQMLHNNSRHDVIQLQADVLQLKFVADSRVVGNKII
jgi:hypothetical protein